MIAKWVAKSFISMVLMFSVSGYLLYISTGQTPWALLGHSSAGSFFYSLLPEVDIGATKQAVEEGLDSVETTISQFVPSDEWGVDSKSSVVEAQEIYRWVDEAGVTHFSEAPPLAVKSEKVPLAPLTNLMPSADVPLDKPREREQILKSLQDKLEQQEAERARVLNEI